MKSGSKYLLGILVLCLASITFAADAVKIQKLVEGFDKIQVFKAIMAGQGPLPMPEDPNDPDPWNPPDQNPPHPPYPPGNCPPSGGFPKGCIEAVCSHVSRFDCDGQNELAEVTRNCRNVNASCVNAICNRVSRFECDEKVELFAVTGMCRGLLDISCIDYVCSRLSRFDCDELSELRRIADQCR